MLSTSIHIQRIIAYTLPFVCAFGLFLLQYSYTNALGVTNETTVLSQNTTVPPTGVNVQNSGGSVQPNPGQRVTLTNPLQSNTITAFLLNIVDIILTLMLPIIILFIMYAGLLFVTARGNTSQIDEAKNTLLYAVLGGVLVLGAKVIIEVIEGTVEALKRA